MLLLVLRAGGANVKAVCGKNADELVKAYDITSEVNKMVQKQRERSDLIIVASLKSSLLFSALVTNVSEDIFVLNKKQPKI